MIVEYVKPAFVYLFGSLEGLIPNKYFEPGLFLACLLLAYLYYSYSQKNFRNYFTASRGGLVFILAVLLFVMLEALAK